jgi:predicted DCC family thiol-disulfide oxidoreductase YuxK
LKYAITAPGEALLFYDAGCGVCSWIVSRVLRSAPSGALRVVPIGSQEAGAYLGHLSDEQRWASWHMLGEDGQLRSAGAAAPVLLDLLPHARPLARLSRAAPRVTERSYQAIARTRSLWGRLVPRGSVARARRELDVVLNEDQSKRGAQCRTIL